MENSKRAPQKCKLGSTIFSLYIPARIDSYAGVVLRWPVTDVHRGNLKSLNRPSYCENWTISECQTLYLFSTLEHCMYVYTYICICKSLGYKNNQLSLDVLHFQLKNQ